MTGSPLPTLLVRAAVCSVVALGAWWLFGPSGLVFAAIPAGVALARPLIDLASEATHLIRRGAYADIEGRHYAYRGRPVRVLEDADHQRWVRLADLRAVLGRGASDAALERLYGAQLRRFGPRRQPYLLAETLARHLTRDTRSEAGRFLHWLDREVVRPARVLQERQGTRPASLDGPPGRTMASDAAPPGGAAEGQDPPDR